jgi:type I restriction enzyme S subunit
MSDWRNITLGDFLSIQRGHDLTATERSEGDVPVFGAAGQNGFHDTARAKGPGIVIGRCGGSYGQVHWSESDFWPHNTALYVTDLKGNDPRFAFYVLKRLNFDSFNSGSAQPSLNRNYIYPIPIRVPEPAQQQKIAAVLSALDAKIALNHRINVELEGMAKLLYDYWFVQYDFPLSAAQAAALGQPHLTGQPYRSSGGPMVYNTQLKREIPKGWKVGSLTHLGEIVGGSTPSTKEIAFFTDHGTPWITPKDLSRNVGNKFITRGQTDLTESGVKSASLAVLPPGSVLMSSRAPIGYTAINRIPVTTNQGFKSFVPSKGYPVEFVYHTLNHLMGVIEQNASGSTFKEISTGALKAIHNVLPDADIIASYQAVVAPMFQQQDTLEQQNQELTTLRDWLLPMLMNGQVRVGCSESAESRQKGGAK